MLCMTWKMGVLTQGIEVVSDKKFGPVVFLGDEGPGRRYEMIQLGRKDPAVVVDGLIRTAFPLRRFSNRGEADEFEFWVLERPRESSYDGKVLIRVSTECEGSKGDRGFWLMAGGEPVEIVKGHGAHGAQGLDGIWDDGLILMREGDIVQVVSENGDVWALYKLNGELGSMRWVDFMALSGDDPVSLDAWEGIEEVAPVIQLRPEPEETEVVIEEPVSTPKQEKKRKKKEKQAEAVAAAKVVVEEKKLTEEEELQKLAEEIAAIDAAEAAQKRQAAMS